MQARAPIELAVDAYWSQQHIDAEYRQSLRSIAREFGVHVSTLSNRVVGTQTDRNTAAAHLQAITPQEEDTLVDFIRRMSLLGNPPAPRTVQDIANHLRQNRLHLDPTYTPSFIPSLGKNWISKFRSRHPTVTSTWTRNLDTARIDGCTYEKLAAWFSEMASILDQNRYDPSNIYNMDESGYTMGASQATRALAIIEKGQKGFRKALKGQTRQEWVTTIECISAAGFAIPPLVIFKGDESFNSGWIPGDLELQVAGWRWAASNRGWSNDYLATEWLKYLFLPLTKPQQANQRRLLIMDGHGSHITPDFIAICMNHSIDLMILPPHTSHITQPLDVGVFGPLKTAMAAELGQYHHTCRERISKAQWARHLVAARLRALSSKNIESGFRRTGLHPFIPNRVLCDFPSTPSTPPRSARSLSRTPLTSLTHENTEFLRIHDEIMRTPVKDRFSRLTSALEAACTDNTLLEMEVKELRELREAKRQKKTGFGVESVGTHIFSTQDVFEQAMARRQATMARKPKKVARKAPEGGPRPLEPNPFISSL